MRSAAVASLQAMHLHYVRDVSRTSLRIDLH